MLQTDILFTSKVSMKRSYFSMRLERYDTNNFSYNKHPLKSQHSDAY